MERDKESNEDQKDELEKAIDLLASSFTDHPGFMWTNTGFEVLHADWPAYPNGHGYKQVLAALADFPADTNFYPVDNIDRCTLFVAGKMPKKDPYHKDLYHVAIWDEDLRECASREFIEGVGIGREYIEYLLGYISVSPTGMHAILINELTYDINPALISQVEDLLYLHHYDDAVRRATFTPSPGSPDFSVWCHLIRGQRACSVVRVPHLAVPSPASFRPRLTATPLPWTRSYPHVSCDS